VELSIGYAVFATQWCMCVFYVTLITEVIDLVL